MAIDFGTPSRIPMPSRCPSFGVLSCDERNEYERPPHALVTYKPTGRKRGRYIWLCVYCVGHFMSQAYQYQSTSTITVQLHHFNGTPFQE